MTDGTQELDEILEKVRYAAYYADYHANHTQEHINSIIAEHVAEQKQAIIDWHNKQVEAVLDRLESSSFGIKQDIEVSQYPARSVYEPEHIAAIHKVVPLSAIEAERNKLKESSND